MDREQLYNLAHNRKAVTSEIHTENCFYGHATIFKQLAKLPEDYQLKVGIQHGITYDLSISSVHRDLIMPVFICATEKYAHNYEQAMEGRKKAFAVGPMIKYATAIPYQVPKGAKTLLVFPPHSSFAVKAQFEHQTFANKVERVAREYNHVLVCIHWRDVLDGIPQFYMERGYDCVTAGHIFDFSFLHRLAGYIETATMVYTPSVGSHVLYSVLLGKPVWLDYQEYELVVQQNKNLQKDLNVKFDYLTFANVQRILKAFAEPRTDISLDQLSLVEELSGLNYLKNGSQLRAIFDEAEELWKSELTLKKRVLSMLRKGIYFQRKLIAHFNSGIVPLSS